MSEPTPPVACAGLGADACARFAADGYLAPLDALSRDAAQDCYRRLAPLLDADGCASPQLRNRPHLLYTWAAALVRDPCVLDAVRSLLGPDLLVLNSVLFIKPANDPGHAAWHQDGTYWDIEGDRVVSAWIAITDSTPESGAVRVVPGSHRSRRRHVLGAEPDAGLLRGQRVEGVRADETANIALRAGQFSLHHLWLLHGSPRNSSVMPRIGLAVRYAAPDVRPRGPRRSATLVRGADRCGHFALEPRPRFDSDPLAARWHRRALRRYAAHVAWQILREPSLDHLRLLSRLAGRADLIRSLVGRDR